ncbi:restriction endonuclease [Jiangella mangrovi]|uniref:Restriction system protein n=1 Tax=Jiangella mangrovi TaxID=1524084 RepID=A0A7W9LPE1_9ACTN|nr:restriction endonuclease [Jiangella mangrovi]MBB5791308.1 restriction system protein [Jiangella mangrovi]
MQREMARAEAARAREQARARREAERARAAYARGLAAEEKERKRLYVESRAADVEVMNEELDSRMKALDDLLRDTLGVDDHLDFETLKQPPRLPGWRFSELERAAHPPRPEQFAPPSPSGLNKVFGKTKHQKAVEAGNTAYAAALTAHQGQERSRLAELDRRQKDYAAAVRDAEAKAAAQHAEVDAFRRDFEGGDPEAVINYFELILQASDYPEGFPQSFKLAYVPESRQAVVEYELPPVDVVPAVKGYRYVKSTDKVNETARPASQVRATYASVVAQIALRTVHELFEADRGRHLDVVVLNGVLHTIDPGSGRPIKPCLVTLRTTRDTFGELDLGRVEPLACLKHLSAGVSKSPAELVPVRPVLEFDMVDPRFVAESDALALLDQRTNLMDLSPGEFESLIQNLFAKMGLDTKQTRASRDGGVDCVAWDQRPIFGGKVVIQAKRYRHTVGVSAVRDLFGTLQNEGASKGILVTTSGYGQASFDFAKNKPIELIDGANLLYLLEEHTGTAAKIVPPEGWKDPLPDSPVHE